MHRAGQAVASDLFGPVFSAGEKGAILEPLASPSRVKGLRGGGEKEDAQSGSQSSKKVGREGSCLHKRR